MYNKESDGPLFSCPLLGSALPSCDQPNSCEDTAEASFVGRDNGVTASQRVKVVPPLVPSLADELNAKCSGKTLSMIPLLFLAACVVLLKVAKINLKQQLHTHTHSGCHTHFGHLHPGHIHSLSKTKSDCDSLGKGHSGVCYDILNYLQIPEIGAVNTHWLRSEHLCGVLMRYNWDEGRAWLLWLQ